MRKNQLKGSDKLLKVFSKTKNGNEKLSDHFKVKEFACKDGSDPVFIDENLIDLLEKVREHFGKPVHVNSGYRTVSYNIRIGGASYSQHCYGRACDIYINGISPKEIAEYVETLIPNTGGIGIYKTFIHIDTRKTKSRWNG